MAPVKKRSKLASKAVVESKDGDGMQLFYNNEAMGSYRGILKRKVIIERGIANVPPFSEYIQKHGWRALCKPPCDPNITMVAEFYANMQFIADDGAVLCRGKQVHLSADIINEYYGLSTDPEVYTEWYKLKKEIGIDGGGALVGKWDEVTREVTSTEFSLEQIIPNKNWGHIDKKYLSMDMNVWYSFIACRLLPVSINSEVQWERLRILYALKKLVKIDVGKMIFASMTNTLGTTNGMGFHSLITALCRRAGCQEKIDDLLKKPMGILTYEAFNRRVQKGQQGISARVGKLEADLKYIKSWCQHTGNLLAHQFPESLEKVGKYPCPPLHEEANPNGNPPNENEVNDDELTEDDEC